MNTFQISTFTGLINNQPIQLVNARDLHKFLRSGREFTTWINHRISKYRFRENLDFIGVDEFVNTEAGFFGMRKKMIREYHLTL